MATNINKEELLKAIDVVITNSEKYRWYLPEYAVEYIKDNIDNLEGFWYHNGKLMCHGDEVISLPKYAGIEGGFLVRD